MNQRTLHAALAKIEPGYTVRKTTGGLVITAAGKTITLGIGNSLALMTVDELYRKLQWTR